MDSTLVVVDSLMWSQPDSAFVLLQNHFNPDDPYAQLLLAELFYKNDYAQTNRGKVLNIVDGFGTTPFLSARAHYINGVGYYENDSVVDACQEYLKALEIMEDHYKEKELVGHRAQFMSLIHNRLGELFTSQFMPESALYCYKKAQVFCKKRPTSPNGIANNYFRIGLQYDIIGQKDSALYYYEKAIEHIPDTNNLVYRNIVSNQALLYYYMNKDSNLALKNLKDIAKLSTNEEEKLGRYLAIGTIHYEEHDFDSAKLYLECVFKNREDEISRIQAAEYLRCIYDSIEESKQVNTCVRFLLEHKRSEWDEKALVSLLDNMFQSYLQHKNQQKAEERAYSIRKTMGIFIPIAILAVMVIFLFAQLRGSRLLKQQRLDTEKALSDKEMLHRTQQSALSARLIQKNREVLELKGQIRHQKQENPSKKHMASSFVDEPICQLIMDRVNKGGFLSHMNYFFYKDYALDKSQIAELRNAVDRHFNQFTSRIGNAYPELTRSDLDYCCLYLLGLTDADVSALMQRAYNTVNERNGKLKRVFNNTNNLSYTLQSIANETI